MVRRSLLAIGLGALGLVAVRWLRGPLGLAPRPRLAPLAPAPAAPAAEQRDGLVVRVTGPDGRPVGGVRVRVGSAEPPAGVQGLRESARAPGALGRVVLDAPGPGRALTLELIDGAGNVVLRREVGGSEPREDGELLLRLPSRPRSLRGRVIDERGHPVPHARLELTGEGAVGLATPCDERGGLCLPGLLSRSFVLEVALRGYVALRLDGPALLEAREPLRIVLECGYDLHVEVRDEDGDSVREGRLALPGLRPGFAALQGGRAFLRDLPSGPNLVRLAIGGAWHERVHDPRDGPLLVVVPTGGQVELAYELPGDPSAGAVWVRLSPLASGREPLLRGLGARRVGHERFEDVPAGDYQVDLVRPATVSPGAAPVWRPLGKGRPLVVRPRATCSVRLSP